MASIYRLGTSEIGKRLERLSMLESALCNGGHKNGLPNAFERLCMVRKLRDTLKIRWFDNYHSEMNRRELDLSMGLEPDTPEPRPVKWLARHPKDLAEIRRRLEATTNPPEGRPTWAPAEGVTFGMWRAVVQIDGDAVTLDVWRPEDEDGYRWDVTTEIYGEIAEGMAADMLAAELAAEAAARVQYPRES